MALLEQEMSEERFIDIPEEVLDVLKIWRPSPLVRARNLEQALGTKSKIYFKNEGVSPDIEVFLHPEDTYNGKDAQLEKGIEVILKKIKEEPFVWPKHGPYPAQK